MGGDFGTVPLLDVEVGFELRAQSGFYLLAVSQAMEPLVVSRRHPDPSRCISSDCPLRFEPGQPVIGARVAAGFVF
jgi:hypothetical protein